MQTTLAGLEPDPLNESCRRLMFVEFCLAFSMDDQVAVKTTASRFAISVNVGNEQSNGSCRFVRFSVLVLAAASLSLIMAW